MDDPLEVIASGPTVPDPTTFSQAIKILEKYNLWSATPQSVEEVLLKGVRGLIEETPKPGDSSFNNVFNVIIGSNRTATLAAVEWLNSEDVSTILLSSKLEGEARETGEELAKLAVEAFGCTTRVERPLAIVTGGETTVTVKGKGLGGRNQELALSAALHLREKKECVFAACSTDGVDGPSDAAGAIVDTFTLERAKSKGLTADEFLKTNDSYHFFSKLGDLIFTKATGTNVNDITIIIG